MLSCLLDNKPSGLATLNIGRMSLNVEPIRSNVMDEIHHHLNRPLENDGSDHENVALAHLR